MSQNFASQRYLRIISGLLLFCIDDIYLFLKFAQETQAK